MVWIVKKNKKNLICPTHMYSKHNWWSFLGIWLSQQPRSILFDRAKCLLHKQINVNIWHFRKQGHYCVNRKKPGNLELNSNTVHWGFIMRWQYLRENQAKVQCYLLASGIILVSKWIVLFDEQPRRRCLAQCRQPSRERINHRFLFPPMHTT